jgi:hypothetical protein
MRVWHGGKRFKKSGRFAVASGPANLPFSENFGDPSYVSTSNSGLSSSWQNQAGVVSVSNSNATGQGPVNTATVNGVSQADVTLQADVNVQRGQSAGLIARYQRTGDKNMYWGAVVSSGKQFVVAIWINVNGFWTRLTALTSIGSTGRGTLQFTVIGHLLRLYRNGTLVVSVNNARLTTGAVGICLSQGATLADFSAS